MTSKEAHLSNFSRKILDLSTLRHFLLVDSTMIETIIKAHGPFVQFSNGNILYDLRSYDYKPLIGHSHPLLIKNDFSIPFCHEIESEFCPLKRAQSTDAKIKINPEIFIFSEQKKYMRKILDHVNSYDLLIENLLYLSADNFFYCDDFVLNAKNIYLSIFLDQKYIINLTDLSSPGLSSIVNYIDTVLLRGKRVKAINTLLEKNLLKRFSVLGTLLFTSYKNHEVIYKLYQEGVYINKQNLIEDKLVFYIPTSITDSQLLELISILNNFAGDF